MNIHVDSTSDESMAISRFLKKNLNVEIFKYIECVTVYSITESFWHERGDIILYDNNYLNAA